MPGKKEAWSALYGGVGEPGLAKFRGKSHTEVSLARSTVGFNELITFE